MVYFIKIKFIENNPLVTLQKIVKNLFYLLLAYKVKDDISYFFCQ